MTELRTDRLHLRQWRDSDFAAFATLNADAEVMEHFPARLTRETSDALATREHARIAARGWGLWAVEVVDAQAGAEAAGSASAPGGATPFIGFVGLAEPEFDAHFTPAVEIGWRLARPAWGHGYATEAAHAVVRFAFDELGLHELVSFTFVENRRSRRVMERLGMTHEPADDFDHPSLAGHPLQRHVLYRLEAPGSVTQT